MSSLLNPPHHPLRTRTHLVVALAGNPNSGKTTIFNALTGLRQKVANYPGVTVEKKMGRCRLPDGRKADIIDLPGTYSLISRSPDERVATDVLRGLQPGTPAPDVVIVIVDASNLQRNLYLVSQLIELGHPLVVALNMMDIAERRGLTVSADALSQKLGVQVIPIVASRRQGIDDLIAAITDARIAPMPDWPMPHAMKAEVKILGEQLFNLKTLDPSASQAGEAARHVQAMAMAERLLIGDHSVDTSKFENAGELTSLVQKSSARLTGLGVDPMQADIEAHYRWIEHVTHAATSHLTNAMNISQRAAGPEDELNDRESLAGSTQESGVNRSEFPTHFEPSTDDARRTRSDHDVEDSRVQRPASSDGHLRSDAGLRNPLDFLPKPTFTQKLDQVLVHKVWGLLIFAGIMGVLFFTIFWIADPIMGAAEEGVAWLGDLVTRVLPAEGALRDLWVDGIVAGVGGVVVFVPQIALLFLFISILEDSGYLARAAFLMDKLLSKVGLHGKSFIPMLSSFACAIPGIMATRTIENRQDRLATIFVAPFMSCSARLPVYTLLIGAFFAGYGALAQAGIMLSMYLIGVLAAVVTAWVFKRTFLKGPATSFILEMPTYKMPQFSQVARQVWVNTWAFLSKAGTIIFCLSVIIWAMTYFPQLPPNRVNEVALDAKVAYVNSLPGVFATGSISAENVESLLWGSMEEEANGAADQAVASAQLRHSLAGRFGHLIEPLIQPLGYDWKMGVGLVGAFAAREVFVSTMGIVYSAGDAEEDAAPLEEAMQSDRYADGRHVWTPLVAVSLLVWFVLAMQCMSTLAIVRRETGGWTYPLVQLAYMNALAYAVCLVIFQVGKAMGG